MITKGSPKNRLKSILTSSICRFNEFALFAGIAFHNFVRDPFSLVISVGRSLKSPDQVQIDEMDFIPFVIAFQIALKWSTLLIYFSLSGIQIFVSSA